jgi:hypothetical protein
MCHSRACLAREESRTPVVSLGAQISPLGVGRLNQPNLRSERHLFDLAFAGNSLVSIVRFFEVDQPVDVK